MKERILLVEDNPATAELIREELQFLGYEALVVQDGQEAVETAISYLPDLIVMDISLPKMDGYQAAAQIKKTSQTRAIPILAATARAMPGDREKCLASGCDAYIAKPFTHRDLGLALRKLLDKPGHRS